ncbi:MAG: PEP-CTERM sorting domain-containing protein [Burkholderiales bacterium]|nr:PEP-CTERM sorting domain-containing protein [Burkholderiales bacterium]
MNTARLTLAFLSTTLALASQVAHADIQIGDATSASAAAGTNLPELVLMVWDPVAKVSYSKDLGVFAYADHYADGNTGKNLFVFGQQDAGYQKLWAPLNTDPLFQQFLSLSGSVTNQIWGIMGVQTNAELDSQAGFRTAFFTLNSGSQASGQRNPNYSSLVGTDANGTPLSPGAIFNNSEFGDAVGNFTTFAGNLNNAVGNLANNTHQCVSVPSRCAGANAAIVDGSSLDGLTSSGYAGTLLQASGALVANGHGSITNPVGKSSWFYSATTSSDVSDIAPTVDEFDNLAHDAYWGLGVDSNGNYILSYTLEAALTQTQTAQGALLRLRTDFAASYGRTRLITVPGGDSLNLGNVTAVPEPSTWGLMGLGLAVLAARARRRT